MMKTLLVVLTVWICKVTANVCDIRHDAYVSYDGLFADCRGRQLSSIPSDLPPAIVALDISENNIQFLNNSMLRKYSNLQFLSLSSNKVYIIQTEALTGLADISTLLLNGNNFGIASGLQILKPLIGRNMTQLDLSDVYSNSKFIRATHFIITVEDTKYLTQICVKEVNLHKNMLVMIEDNALFGEPFVNCIEKLDISGNILLGNTKILFELSRFTKLKYLLLGNQMLSFGLPEHQVSLRMSSALKAITNIALPSTLEYLDISKTLHIVKANTNVVFENSTNLKTLILGYNSLPGQMTIRGLESVETLDLSSNDLGFVSDGFFESMLNLKKLSVHNCNMRFKKVPLKVLKSLNMLESLDLSQNFLTDFPILPNTSYIQKLNLSGNAFEDIPFNMISYPNMKKLDMSYNSITSLNLHMRTSLDVAFLKSNVSLMLKDNTLSCGCQNLDFILWLTNTPIIQESDRDFICIQDDGTMTRTADVARNYISITRHCNGKMLLTMTVIFALIFMISLIFIYIVAKNPTRYRNMILRWIWPHISPLYTSDEFHFKFYVGYCEADIHLVYREMRPAMELCHHPVHLFLKDREVLPGVDIADGIVVGINSSWKTILVVSWDYLKDPWSNFTINTAVFSMLDLIPDRIIVLLVGEVKIEDLPETLLNAVDEEFIYHMDDYEEREETLWKRFREMN